MTFQLTMLTLCLSMKKDFMCYDNESGMPWGVTRLCSLRDKELIKGGLQHEAATTLLADRHGYLARISKADAERNRIGCWLLGQQRADCGTIRQERRAP